MIAWTNYFKPWWAVPNLAVFFLELSHRSPQYAELNQETMDILRRLLCVPLLSQCVAVFSNNPSFLPLSSFFFPSSYSLLIFSLPSLLPLSPFYPPSLPPFLPSSLLQKNSYQLQNTPTTRWRHGPVCCHTHEPLSVQWPGNRLLCNWDLVQQGCKGGREVYEGEPCSAQEEPVYKHTQQRPVAADTRCSLRILLRQWNCTRWVVSIVKVLLKKIVKGGNIRFLKGNSLYTNTGPPP